MSTNIPSKIKTGTGEIANSQKALLLSLMGVYVEETLKTSLLYALHHGRTIVNTQDMLKAMKFELMSESGCGIELKLKLKEAMTSDSFISSDDNNDHNNNNNNEEKNTVSKRALDLYPTIYESLTTETTVAQQTNNLISTFVEEKRIVGNKRRRDKDDDEQHNTEDDEENEEDNDDNNQEEEEEEEDEEDNIEEDEDEEDNIEEDEDEEDNIEEDEDGEDNSELNCDCSMCVEVDKLFLVDFQPKDEFEKLICQRFQCVADKFL